MKIALVNSRKPRQFHPDEPWLSATMALGYAIARAGHTLCASVGTIGYDVALFGALQGRGAIEVFVPEGEELYLKTCLPSSVSPNIVAVHSLPRTAENTNWRRDQTVIDAADSTIAIAIRSGGHMERMLLERIAAGKNVRLVLPDDTNASWRGTQKLAAAGARPVDARLWDLAQEKIQSRRTVDRDKLDWSASFPVWNDAPFETPTLAHFTRAAEGAWPGQSYSEFLEDLWHGGMRARRDAEAALWRIVESRKLAASSRLIRGRFPVVSFTAVSPARIHELRQYRSHLARWDFEPWGIVFDRDWLVKQRALPVRYLPSASYSSLDSEQRPYFQKHEPPTSDYSMEEEWRVVGDLDFSTADRDCVRLVLGK